MMSVGTNQAKKQLFLHKLHLFESLATSEADSRRAKLRQPDKENARALVARRSPKCASPTSSAKSRRKSVLTPVQSPSNNGARARQPTPPRKLLVTKNSETCLSTTATTATAHKEPEKTIAQLEKQLQAAEQALSRQNLADCKRWLAVSTSLHSKTVVSTVLEVQKQLFDAIEEHKRRLNVDGASARSMPHGSDGAVTDSVRWQCGCNLKF